MASITVKRLLEGWGSGASPVTVITHVQFTCAEDSGTVTLPAEQDGHPVTHLGYEQDFVAAHEEWADWQHGKGCTIPDHYSLEPVPITVPAFVERLVIPATLIDIAPRMLHLAGDTVIEVDPQNPVYRAVDGKLEKK